MYKLAAFFSGVLGTTLLLIACTSWSDRVPEAQGVILIESKGGGTSAVFEPSTGVLRTVEWKDTEIPDFHCRGTGDTVLLDSRIDLTGAEDSYGRYKSLYKWLPPHADSLFSTDLIGPRRGHRTLDYSPERGEYLLCGELNGETGAFILDETLAVREVLCKSGSITNSRCPDEAYFWGETAIIVTILGSRWLLEDGDSLMLDMPECDIVALCYDRQQLVYLQGAPAATDTELFIYSIADGSSKRIDIAKDVCTAALSPDGRFLAYAHDPNFNTRRRLSIIDLDTGEKYHSQIRCGCGRLLWIDSLEADWKAGRRDDG